jgi:hypothetical protein
MPSETRGAQIDSPGPGGAMVTAMRGDGPAWLSLWLAPIRDPMRIAAASVDKPVGQMTMGELMSWAAVLAYAGLSGYVAGRIAGNLALAALRGPGRF